MRVAALYDVHGNLPAPTTIFKLVLRRDPASWSIGLAVGAAAGVIAAPRQRRQ
jgi:hypothetical protein